MNDENMNMPEIGRRMPYKVPDGMFDDIERNVLSATDCGRKTSRGIRTVSIALAVAASLALTVIFSWHRQPSADSLAEVQQAFANLDNADRAFLSEVYDEDTFMNMNY